MPPPAHVRLRTIPREELNLWGVGKRARAKSNSFTMRGFLALLSGPSDIQVRAPGISWPIFVEVFEGIFNVNLKLNSKGKSVVRAPPAVAVALAKRLLCGQPLLYRLRALGHHWEPLLATCAGSWDVQVHHINGPL